MVEPKTKTPPSPVGYYMLHSCSDSGDHQDACDGVFVWASSPEEALSLDPEKHRDPETVEVERQAEADKFHKFLGDRWGNGWGSSGVEEERAYRAIGFREDGGTSCETCGLYEFPKVPESKVCRECFGCAECGCVCGDELAEKIAEAEARARAKAFEEAAEIARKFRPAPNGHLSEVMQNEHRLQWHAAEEIARAIERAKEAPPRG